MWNCAKQSAKFAEIIIILWKICTAQMCVIHATCVGCSVSPMWVYSVVLDSSVRRIADARRSKRPVVLGSSEKKLLPQPGQTGRAQPSTPQVLQSPHLAGNRPAPPRPREHQNLAGKIKGKRSRGRQRITFIEILNPWAVGIGSNNFIMLTENMFQWKAMIANVYSSQDTDIRRQAAPVHKVISGFEAFCQLRALVAWLEPTTKRSLQISERTRPHFEPDRVAIILTLNLLLLL
ncbi:hypothetical protein PoB_000268500 [Plakobranchus ocellatus]|uniref:Uncharacterized protein n=1 Tax=Plakobranchus ocellatus TaxID=259542 RepID=A0AAV3Y0G5_9GAST|nr:hypothetical protein PoB_000268500 [Plakobranchus ocellatus]